MQRNQYDNLYVLGLSGLPSESLLRPDMKGALVNAELLERLCTNKAIALQVSSKIFGQGWALFAFLADAIAASVALSDLRVVQRIEDQIADVKILVWGPLRHSSLSHDEAIPNEGHVVWIHRQYDASSPEFNQSVYLHDPNLKHPPVLLPGTLPPRSPSTIETLIHPTLFTALTEGLTALPPASPANISSFLASARQATQIYHSWTSDHNKTREMSAEEREKGEEIKENICAFMNFVQTAVFIYGEMSDCDIFGEINTDFHL